MALRPPCHRSRSHSRARVRRRRHRIHGRVQPRAIEPHTESIADTPEKAAALVSLTPGLTLTLDYSHFIFEGATEDDVEPLLPAARHVQCRGGAPGVLQADMRNNQIDYPRMVRRLAELGYDGYLATEYVWTDWHDCDKVDNLTSTVALRDVLRGVLT